MSFHFFSSTSLCLPSPSYCYPAPTSTTHSRWLYMSVPEGCTILHPRIPVSGLTHAMHVVVRLFLAVYELCIYTQLVVVVLSSFVFVYFLAQSKSPFLTLPFDCCPHSSLRALEKLRVSTLNYLESTASPSGTRRAYKTC